MKRSIVRGARIHIFGFCIILLKSIVFEVCKHEYMNLGFPCYRLSTPLWCPVIQSTIFPEFFLKLLSLHDLTFTCGVFWHKCIPSCRLIKFKVDVRLSCQQYDEKISSESWLRSGCPKTSVIRKEILRNPVLFKFTTFVVLK